MFFYLSKIVWWVAAPSNVLVGLVVIGAVLLFTRWNRGGRRMVAVGGLGLLVCGMAPVGIMLARPLENRFPVLSQDMPPPTGIIVLGGSIDQITTAARGGQVAIGAAGSRITEAAALAHRFPQARLVFTGGSNALFAQDAEDEAAAAAKLFAQMGIAPERIAIERESRNTWENALLTKALVKPQPGERWLLVTSAWHMPRSVGIFRVAAFDVVPYPVDFESRNTEREIRRPVLPMSRGLDLVDRMAREWVGLLAYRVGGRTDTLFPAPR